MELFRNSGTSCIFRNKFLMNIRCRLFRKTKTKINISIYNISLEGVHSIVIIVSRGRFPDLGVITFEAATGFKDFIRVASAFNDHKAKKTELRITFGAFNI
jgi:hypothetical protein